MHLQAENPMIFNVKLFDIMFYSLKLGYQTFFITKIGIWDWVKLILH